MSDPGTHPGQLAHGSPYLAHSLLVQLALCLSGALHHACTLSDGPVTWFLPWCLYLKLVVLVTAVMEDEHLVLPARLPLTCTTWFTDAACLHCSTGSSFQNSYGIAQCCACCLRCCCCCVCLLTVQGLGLVFVAVYQKTLSLLYVDDLLKMVKEAFAKDYSPNSYCYDPFTSKFDKILRDCEARADAARRNAAALPQPKATAATATAAAAAAASRGAGQQGGKTAKSGGSSDDSSGSDADDAAAAAGGVAAGGGSSTEECSSGGEESGGKSGFDLAKLKAKSGKRRTAGVAPDSTAKGKPAVAAVGAKKKQVGLPGFWAETALVFVSCLSCLETCCILLGVECCKHIGRL